LFFVVVMKSLVSHPLWRTAKCEKDSDVHANNIQQLWSTCTIKASVVVLEWRDMTNVSWYSDW